MADNFASYFPVTVTGGTTNPMVGADVVQGPNPQALGLDPILAAIQSQYTPQTFTHSGGSYGAQRFIDGSSGVSGFTPPVIGGGNIAQPWFTPGAFNLADYQTDLPSDLAEQVATGSVYGGDSYSPVSNVGNEAWMSDPYAGLDPITGLRSGVNAFIPGAGLLIGAAQGYSGATSANTLNDVLNYLGDEGLGKVDPLKATALGAFGITPQSLKDAQEFYKIFDQNSATMLNWAAQPKDAASNQIVDFLMEGAQNPLSPQDIGVMSWAVRSDIDQAVAGGKNLTDAVRDVAISKGIDPTRAAEMGVSASRSAIEQGLKEGLSLQDMDPAAVAVYNDPLGALIDSLGITGKINESVAAATTPINEQLSGLQNQVEQYKESGLTADQALQQAIADMQTGVTGQIEGLAASDEAFQQALADIQTGVTGQINTQGEQFQALLDQYQQVGMTQNEALNQAIADMSSNLSNQVNTQGEQFQTLLSQYQEVGMSRDEALQQAIADIQTGVTGQINTQGEQFQTLLDQYQQVGMTQNEALNQTIADLSSSLTNQVNTQGEQFQTLLNQYQEVGLSQNEALQQALADMQSDVSNLNFATPEDVTAAVGNLNFATAEDIQTALSGLDYSTPDDISEALAGLDIPTVDDIISAIATPVTGEVTSGTSFQPANADGSFVSGIPDVGVPDSIDGVTFDDVIGAISTPVYSPDLPTPTPIAPISSGSQYDSGVITTSPSRSISDVTTTPSVDYGSIADFGGTGSDSYAPTANEISFSESGGYTADVGGYDATSGYDTDTDSGGDSGGGGGGGGKIVCTAMNQSYGFGSYRNAIWLKYSADRMTKAHEAGYHAIFLPLVDLAYKRNNKPVRIALEHIARHRTADLRAEMRGSKRDTLGRAYRFVLEPLCYVVGKIKGY